MTNDLPDPTAGISEYAVPSVHSNDRILVFRVQNRFETRAYAILIPFDADRGDFTQPRLLPHYGAWGAVLAINYDVDSRCIDLARSILRACVPVELAELWAENFARRVLAVQTAGAWQLSVAYIIWRVQTWDHKHPEAKYRGAPEIGDDESEDQPE